MKKLLLAIIAILIIAAGAYYFLANTEDAVYTTGDVATTTVTLADTSPKVYTSPTRNFSFTHPGSLEISSFETDGVESVVAYDAESQVGFQIEITPIDEDIDALTVERIRKDLPDILIEYPQEVILGANGKGVAFVSDDPAFDGRSREVWFVFDKYLYQVRTYMKYDDVLKSVLNTWKFN